MSLRLVTPLRLHSEKAAARWKTVVITLGLIAFAVQWVRVGSKEVGDFKLHWEFECTCRHLS